MPKTPKNPKYPPIRTLRQTACGVGGGDFVPVDPLLLVLSRLNREALVGLSAGESVLLQIDSSPIQVTTLVGLPIGQVREGDVAAVLRRRKRRGSIYLVEFDPLRCVVEVP